MRRDWATSFGRRQLLSSRDERRQLPGAMFPRHCRVSITVARAKMRQHPGGFPPVCGVTISLLVFAALLFGPTDPVRVQAGLIHAGTPVFEREMARYRRAKGHSQSGGAGAVHQRTIPAEPSRPSPNRPPREPELLFGGLGSSCGGLGTGTVPVSSSSSPACLSTSSLRPIPRILWRVRYRDVIHSCYEQSPPLVPS